MVFILFFVTMTYALIWHVNFVEGGRKHSISVLVFITPKLKKCCFSW